MNLRRARPSEASINLTPLIDILFIVLLFLVLTATFREATRLRVRLPEASSGARVRAQPIGDLRVSVDEAGALYVGDDVVTLSELRERMRAHGPARDMNLVLSADERADHGRVVEVMDLARRNGIYRINIETLHVERVEP